MDFILTEEDGMDFLGSTSIQSFYSKPMLPWLVSEVLVHDECLRISLTKKEQDMLILTKNRSQLLHKYSQGKKALDSVSNSSNESQSNDLISFDDNQGIENSDDTSTAATVSDVKMRIIMQCNIKHVKDVFEVMFMKKQYLLLFTQESKKVPIYCYILNTENIGTFRKTLKDFHDIAIRNKIDDSQNDVSHTEDTDSIKFEVMLLGKLNVKTLHPPTTFIDDSVKKIEHHHLLHHHHHDNHHHFPVNLVKVPSVDGSVEEIYHTTLKEEEELQTRQRCQSVSHAESSFAIRRRQRHSSEPSVPESSSHRSKIRLLLIGKSSLKLLCPVNTFRAIEIKFSNISKCMQGCALKDHFGFIANDIKHDHSSNTKSASDSHTDAFRRICYVFKCAEEYVCEEIMQGLKQAFLTCDNETSPMNEYHLLCIAINGRKNFADKILLANNAVSSLNENEKVCILAQLSEMQPKSEEERLGAIMTTLRHSYEVRHVQHKSQIRANSMNALSQYESPLFFSKKIVNLKSKAKNSFESFLQKGRRKMLELQSDAEHLTDHLSDIAHQTTPGKLNSLRVGEVNMSHSAPVTPQKEYDNKFKTRKVKREKSKEQENSDNIMIRDMPHFHRIYGVINNNSVSESIDSAFDSRRKLNTNLTTDELRETWKWAVTQQILINKIRKIQLKEPIDPTVEVTSNKSKYTPLVPVPSIMQEIWEEIIALPCEIYGAKKELNIQVLQIAITKGIDCYQRGRVWKFLQEQWLFRRYPKLENNITAIKYAQILQNLTSYQHAILIDIGRTFPNQQFYSQSLGAGQLALFNLLKAYSLTDTEVGYCQGLSFVAGVLLMHTCVEWEAFELLHHLMHEVECRTMYMPDMKGIRLAVYKLSRLLYDMQNDLFLFFEENEVSMLLISTPWFLTMFASTFSINFVARVFDMVFVNGIEALFRVALCTLIHHKKEIMACRDFEEIVNYIRTVVPKMSTEDMASIISQALLLDIGVKLKEYAIEYRLLYREYALYLEINADHQKIVEELEMIKQINKTVTESNCDLMQQLHAAHQKNAMLQKQIANLTLQK